MNLQLLIAKDLPFECFSTSLDVDVPMGLARRTSPSQVPVLTSTFLSVWLQVQVPVLTLTVLSVWLQIHVPVLTLRFLSVTRLQVQVPVLPLAFLSVWLQVPVLTLTFLLVWLTATILGAQDGGLLPEETETATTLMDRDSTPSEFSVEHIV